MDDNKLKDPSFNPCLCCSADTCPDPGKYDMESHYTLFDKFFDGAMTGSAASELVKRDGIEKAIENARKIAIAMLYERSKTFDLKSISPVDAKSTSPLDTSKNKSFADIMHDRYFDLYKRVYGTYPHSTYTTTKGTLSTTTSTSNEG